MLEYVNVGKEFIIKGSRPGGGSDSPEAVTGGTGFPIGAGLRCNMYSKFCMKNLQKNREKRPKKKKTRKMKVRTMVIGGE